VITDLPSGALTRIMRPTMLSALGVGAVAFAVALLVLNSTLGALGIALGVGVAILNVRVLGNGIVKVPTGEEPNSKVVRRLLRTHSAVRLAAITAVAIALTLLEPPLGIGMVVGLVVFQICFVANAGRAILHDGPTGAGQ